MSRIRLVATALLISLLTITSSLAQTNASIERAFAPLIFSSPVFLTHSGDGTDRIFVLEQTGRIKVFPNDPALAPNNVHVFLDLTPSMARFHNEAGVLGLAFHPDYRTNGFFFVNYTRAGPNRTVVSRFSVDPENANRADPGSELVILEIEQDFLNHNAGMMQFGPEDGYLYISTGDGGDRRPNEPVFPADPGNHGQNLKTLHSAILRIDVNHPSAAGPYSIPPDNPYAGNVEGWREEIWAYGLRNPWRFSIDAATNQLWVGDVGAKGWEEINLVERGDNLGWSVTEGAECFGKDDCESTGIKLPVFQHRYEGNCNSITGGYVYHGSRRPELQGAYIYGDYCLGEIRMFRYEDGAAQDYAQLYKANFRISSFGTDEQDELFILDHSNGRIYQLGHSETPTNTEWALTLPEDFVLHQNYPNPFNPGTEINFVLREAGQVDLTVFDLAGRRIRTLHSGGLQPGGYAIGWDGTDASGLPAATGVYLYVLRTGTRSESRKMILLR